MDDATNHLSPSSALFVSVSLFRSIVGQIQNILHHIQLESDDGTSVSRATHMLTEDDDDDSSRGKMQREMDCWRLSLSTDMPDIMAAESVEASETSADDDVEQLNDPSSVMVDSPCPNGTDSLRPSSKSQVIFDPRRQELFLHWQDLYWKQEPPKKETLSSSSASDPLAQYPASVAAAATAAANSLLSDAATAKPATKKKPPLTEKARRAEMTRFLKDLWNEFLAEEEAIQDALCKAHKRGRRWN